MSHRPPRLSREVRRQLDVLLDEAFACLDDGVIEDARAHLAAAEVLAALDPDVLYLAAEIAVQNQDWSHARHKLEHALTLVPSFADAHALISQVFEHLGDRKAMIAHSLQVLALDARADRRRGPDKSELFAFIEGEVRRVFSALPPELCVRLRDVPVVLEARPSFALVREGFDPRALGLFEGRTDGDHSSVAVAPTRIVLFYANLLAICEDMDVLSEQIEITVLHEIGHFFGLDEDGVAALGLA